MKNLLFLISLALLLISGCGANDNNDNIEDDYGKIYFRPMHIYDSGTGELKNGLSLKTEKIYGSTIYFLDIDQYYSQGAIVLNVKGVAKAEGGAEILTPAIKILDLDAYEGTFPLIIKSPKFQDEYQLKIVNDTITIEGPATAHTVPTLRILEAGISYEGQQ